MIVFGKTTPGISTAPFLIKAEEREGNEIKFVVALPVCGERGEGGEKTRHSKLDGLLRKAAPIYADKNERYEIAFPRYVLHMTRNESYTCWDDYEIRRGDYFILFDRSRLLDHVPQIVGEEIVNLHYPHGYKHYGIYCQNHIVDIIAAEEPEIKKL